MAANQRKPARASATMQRQAMIACVLVMQSLVASVSPLQCARASVSPSLTHFRSALPLSLLAQPSDYLRRFSSAVRLRMDTGIDAELLIELVRNQEHLYDGSAKDYNNYLAKEKTWLSIATTLNSTPLEVKKKWKNLRDSFARVYSKCCLYTGEGPRPEAKWAHFTSLMFLADTLRPRRSQRYGSLFFHDIDETNEVECKPDVSRLVVPTYSGDSPQTTTATSIPEVGVVSSRRTPESEGPSSKRLRPDEDFMERDIDRDAQRCFVSSVKSEPIDVNDAFGRLVTASLRELPRDKQALLRFKICELIYSIGES